ncbi:MAG: MMPL family transporter [Hydrogenophaga sp.]|uniref:efflux RND transporter permease subunit n=1 Tax=Hydrogenophaga sp. TaxID=1904254 RepID=UPI0016A8E961|nr:efflux RND transporter permease subunit [Hydrogenophaga sp.]NIM43824.1 MMPL family transporter [Hydrogenophaga sp.]NIN28890.1 MMPL family transporter [Hydrogenophaga sp.]NIN33349.1 MMPL family transporter [Hydrogenophaga sp.]NIN58024.1 MMPL family transporter [Hydrogenophaga sp.]NIO54322.1 MMPL family transporter [Hydrogenophaga sp.]
MSAAPSLSRPFILRPVATSLLMLAVLIAGLLAWRQLPVSALPQVDYPVIQVFTFQPGASPEVTARTVTAPLERRLGQIPGLAQMSSTSSGGASVITMKFALEVDLGVAEQDVQAALQSANSLLPSDLPAPPIYRKVNPADVPILTLAISSETLPLPRVVDLVDTRMAGQLSRLPGVGLVSLAGGQRPAIRVQANSRALAANGLTLEELRTAIAAANNNQPKGSFDGELRSTMLDANDQLRSVAEYRRLIVAWRDGAPLRLGDVATVAEGAEDRFLAAWAGMACAEGQSAHCGLAPAVLLNIQRQPGANVIAVADQVRALLPQLTATLPATVKVQVVSDRTESIRASVRDVQKELLFAIALVVLVTFVFLRTPAATLIPSVAVPLSLVGTFAAMLLMGYSLNNLSLMALTIATGFVVDDAIVMLENIARHREEGAGRMEAALKGASEIGFTLVSLTVSLVAVLIPLLFMADVVGRLFHEFAVTLAVAIAISLVVSLTLTPMMAARMLPRPPAHGKQRDWLSGTIERYGRWLDWVLARQPLALLAMAATLLLTGLLYLAVPKGFFPVQDAGAIQVVTEAPQSVSFGAMAERQQALATALLDEAPVHSIASYIGVDGSNATLNSGRMLITLAPHAQRSVSAGELIDRLRDKARGVDGIQAWFQPVQELGLEDRISRTQYQFTLSSPDSALLAEWSDRLLQALQQRPELADVAGNLQREGLQAYLEVDRDAAARLGLRMSDIASALQSAFGQRQVSTLFTHASQYRVVLESDDAARGGLQALEGVFVRPANGGADAAPVPLSAVARAVERRAPLAIEHQGQFPAATLSFNLAPGHSLGEAVAAIEAVQQQIELPLAVELAFQGAAEGFRSSLANTLWLILAAVVVMYLVLGMLYESAVHPLTILSTLPSATVGALAALLLAGRPLDMIAVIGIVLLIGLVKKNGIMMVDFALDAQRRLGLSPREAIHRAALLRFRPILMTTLAALFGAVPLMLASGSGAELRQPLGIVMVGGLILSQVLTLFTTPVVYLAFDRLGRGRAGRTTDA